MPDEEPVPVGPPLKVNVSDVADQEIDAKAWAKLSGEGTKDSGLPERLAAAFFMAGAKAIAPYVRVAAETADELLAAVAEVFHAAQAEGTKGFSDLVAGLLGDLLGVGVNGEQIFQAFQTRGRLEAMETVGSSLVDLLTKEFSGGGGLSPEQGRNAIRTFLGFVLSFSVREGNTDLLTSLIPEDIRVADGFKGYAEAMARNLGLGRLTRLALRPLVQTLLVTPALWDLNKRYTPTLLNPGQAIHTANAELMTDDQFQEEMARHGYDKTHIDWVRAADTKYPAERELFLAELAGVLHPDRHKALLKDQGFTEEFAGVVRTAEANQVRRQISMELAHRVLLQVLQGTVDPLAYGDLIDKLFLTDDEKAALQSFTSLNLTHQPRRITFAQMQSAFEQAIVTIDEVEAYLVQRGYPEDDVHVLIIETLLKSAKLEDANKRKTARAAAKAPKHPKGTQTPPG